MESHPIKNRVEEVSGKIKEVTGKVFGDKSLENRGTIEKIDGKVKVQIDQIKSDVKKHTLKTPTPDSIL